MSREVAESLKPLFEKARREGLWFYCSYQGLWFSPDELAAAQAEGRFRWGAVNWTLRDPREYLEALESSLRDAEAAVKNVKVRIGCGGNSS